MSYLHDQLLRGLRANTDSILYFMSPHCPNRVSRIKHSLNACQLSCLVKLAMTVERSPADNLQIERPRDRMFRKGSTEQYNYRKMNKQHYKEALVFLLMDALWVLVTTNITISTESLSIPMGVQIHVSAPPFCSVPVTGNHSISWGFKCKAQILALGNLSGNGFWTNHSISRRFKKQGWGRQPRAQPCDAAEAVWWVPLCSHGRTCQDLHHRGPSSPPPALDGHCCP